MHSNLCGKGEEHSFSYYDNIWYHCFVDVIVSLIIHSQCNGGEGCELSSTLDAATTPSSTLAVATTPVYSLDDIFK